MGHFFTTVHHGPPTQNCFIPCPVFKVFKNTGFDVLRLNQTVSYFAQYQEVFTPQRKIFFLNLPVSNVVHSDFHKTGDGKAATLGPSLRITVKKSEI